MKIKKLELCGFKSFKDRTVVQFDGGITGVVGPNGCGKSNIVDALQWVMGEQSAKHLRGSHMSDVIFAGSEGYAPMGMAEVSLILENDGGPFPARYARFQEIMVTRRLHRSGDSEYLINKETARLRDVHELFMDTGVGAKGFSIIEQGAIGKIITAKPEDRRHLIEEAAGITKFRIRKRESERKLEATEQNLVRLADIVGEIKRQLDSLQRQAKKAEKYRELKAQLRDLDLWQSCKQYTEINEEVEVFRKQLVIHEDLSQRSTSRKSELEASIQELKLTLLELEKKVHSKQSERFEAQSEVQRKEGEIQKITFEIEQARRNGLMTGNLHQELQIRRASLETDVVQVRARCESAKTDSEKLKNQLESQQGILTNFRLNLNVCDNEVIQKRRAIVTTDQAWAHIQVQVSSGDVRLSDYQERLERELAVLGELDLRKIELDQQKKRNFDDLERERQLQLSIMTDADNFASNKKSIEEILESKNLDLEEKKQNLTRVDSHLSSLEGLDQNLEGFQEGVKQVLGWQKESGSSEHRVVADLISVANQYEVAVEVALGQKLQMLVSKTTFGAVDAIKLLKEKSWGRSSFFPLTDLPSSPLKGGSGQSAGPTPEEVEARLIDVVKVLDQSYESVFQVLLGSVAIASDLNSAISLKVKFPDWTFVTRHGEMLSADGVLSGGSLESVQSGLLMRKREIIQLRGERDLLAAQVALVQHEVKSFRSKYEGVSKDLENSHKAKNEKEIVIVERKKDLERAENELQNLVTSVRRKQSEIVEIQNLMNVQESKLSELRSEFVKLTQRKTELETEIESFSSQLGVFKKQTEDQNVVVTELQVQSASKSQEYEGLQKQVSLFEQSLRDIDEQMARMDEESQKSKETLTLGQIQLEQEKVRLEGLVHGVQLIQSQLSNVQNDFERIGAQVRTQDVDLADFTRQANEARTQIAEVSLKVEQLTLRSQNITGQIFEKYSQPLNEILRDYSSQVRDKESVSSEISELRDKISKMGEVSLSAINEYEELTQRYEFLTKQQNDLLESKDQLRKVIDRIDKICDRQFRDTFDSVNERFKMVFPVLFGGGEASLAMVQDEGHTDPGIDIIVKPPGKKMQNITLLSGGEKALTSVALIFAIFLVKPSPFCLLDEVDAPLDDANVLRFNELVREMAKRSQIIIVTHNKYTMEVNNKLYGVTMEERGVSKMVSVDLTDARRPTAPEASL